MNHARKRVARRKTAFYEGIDRANRKSAAGRLLTRAVRGVSSPL